MKKFIIVMVLRDERNTEKKHNLNVSQRTKAYKACHRTKEEGNRELSSKGVIVMNVAFNDTLEVATFVVVVKVPKYSRIRDVTEKGRANSNPKTPDTILKCRKK